jgi:Tfp pilus assembly protein PilX
MRTDPRAFPDPAASRGAALIVGLVLLTALTVLAVSTMRTSTLQLAMAGSTRDREAAFNAAEAGIAAAVNGIEGGGLVLPATTPGTCLAGPASAGTVGTMKYTYATRICYLGPTTDIVPDQSGNAATALHFSVIADATAGDRGARARHTYGFYKLGNS